MAAPDPRALTTLDAHLAYLRALTTAGKAAMVEHDGIFLVRNPVPLPFLVNAAARTGAAVEAPVVLEAARSFFGGQGFEVLCLEGRDDDLRIAAERAGLHIGSPDPLQYLDRQPVPSPADRSAVQIHVVDDVAGVAEVAAVNQDASAVYRFPEGLFAAVFAAPSSVLSPAIHAVLAYVDGAPVATAQVFMHAEVAYVGWVAVVPNAARRGLGWLVTETVVNEGLARGAKAAVLVASPMGAPLYRKMGFVDVGWLRNAYERTAAG
jgi:GNAT superfamily N-acetyltransferase